MTDIAIRAENLGKLYRIGHRERYRALRDTLTDAMYAPLRRIRSAFQRPSVPASEHANEDNTFWALKDVSFEIMCGEVVGIIGRNGAGKSTLLKILSRITEPTEGTVELHGRVGSLLEVGTGFHPELTGRENIYLNGAILGMKRIELDRKFDEIVAFAEIEKFLDTPVKHYSSGMYVRLAFAVAAHLEPEILLVDEVLAVGDAAFQKKCLGKMSDVSKAGRTVLFVSHNMQAVNSLCSRGIFLSTGKIAGSGDVASVVKVYLASATGHVPERLEQVWDDMDTAPGNDKIRLHRIAVVPEGSAHLIDLTTSFRVEIEYWNLTPLTRLHIDLCLYTLEDSPVFETLSWKEPHWHDKPFPSGLFRSTCHIPGDLLNEGTYRIRVLFVDDCSRKLYDNHEATTFAVHEMAGRQDLWYGKFIGPVRPQLQWETELVSSHM
ncbi:MAG: ATP-binding cassette domain-containing protein [candidate division NC10 bacterium]|nr:ATP-binding cassette domain-containing protein [candidate division NC10 bacterium]MDE2321489.1 ATP-binding cassette domain-containing protein [candidate division NC10 bacterium]